ncbi:MAG: transposase [Gammaproteobacteria bacterium]|nr:transposase [Gammaproteobacteria bacterium]
MSRWLDDHPEVLAWIGKDLGADGKRLGRTGMTCEQVLRIGLIKQFRQCSYRELRVALADSLSAQYFARIDPLAIPARSTLQANVSAIKAETWEQLNRMLVESVLGTEFEPGERIRIDSTVSETHILDPTDSKLLYDSVRVMTRF